MNLKFVRKGDIVWNKNYPYDGTYLHHRPKKYHVLSDLDNYQVLQCNPIVLIQGEKGKFAIALSELHATEKAAAFAFMQRLIEYKVHKK